MRPFCATVLLALPLAACGTTDHARSVAGIESLLAEPPRPYRVAIAPVAIDAESARPAPGSQLAFTFDADRLQRRIVADLATYRTGSDIVAIEGEDLLGAAETARADLVVRPRVTDVRLTHLGGNTQGVVSSILWLTTWVGGLFVADNDYQARLKVEWELVNPHDGKTLDVHASTSTDQTLAFSDRNPALSWATLQSFVVPPIWTSDDTDKTAENLSSLAIASVSAMLARHLKSGMSGQERELCGELRLDTPTNGSVTTRDHTAIRGRVVAAKQIQRIAIYANGERVHAATATELPQRDAQEMGRMFQVPIDVPNVPLQSGVNEIRVLLQIGGYETTRTVVVQREEVQR